MDNAKRVPRLVNVLCSALSKGTEFGPTIPRLVPTVALATDPLFDKAAGKCLLLKVCSIQRGC